MRARVIGEAHSKPYVTSKIRYRIRRSRRRSSMWRSAKRRAHSTLWRRRIEIDRVPCCFCGSRPHWIRSAPNRGSSHCSNACRCRANSPSSQCRGCFARCTRAAADHFGWPRRCGFSAAADVRPANPALRMRCRDDAPFHESASGETSPAGCARAVLLRVNQIPVENAYVHSPPRV
jgi:hypothetical protein